MLSRASFRGFMTRIANEDYSQAVKESMLKRVGMNTNTPVTSLPEIHPLEFDLKECTPAESFLAESEVQDLCNMFNVRSLNGSDVAILKLSLVPHKNGPHAVKARFQWNGILERMLGCKFEDFFKHCEEEWRHISGESKPLPFFWRLFSFRSYRKVINLMFDAYFEDKLESIEELDFASINGSKTKCCVKWKVSLYPLIQMPESILIAARPVSNVFNPFRFPSQKNYLTQNQNK
jgi:hypothetical protein